MNKKYWAIFNKNEDEDKVDLELHKKHLNSEAGYCRCRGRDKSSASTERGREWCRVGNVDI